MTTEVWFRNPDSYIRELIEVGANKIAWDRGLLVKKKIDADKHALLYFGTMDYQIMLVGDQGTALLTPGHTFNKPKAVFPTWRYGDDGAVLEELIEKPVGLDREICNDLSLPADERPVYGQEHRVVITDIPPGSSGPGRKFIRYLKELQEDHPECIIHVHGFYAWRLAFGQGFASADVQPRDAAAKGKIHLPSGKEERFEQAQAHPQWITRLGFKPADLEIPRNRCMYNIKSALWAGENYEKIFTAYTRGSKREVDITSPANEFVPPGPKSHLTSFKKKAEGDNFVCNECSLQNKCHYYREGAVCTVPGAEPTRLAKLFGSRDADTIIDGLGILMSRNTTRLEGALELEEIDGELDPETTKLVGQVFDQAVKLVRLVDPSRFKSGGVQVNVGPGGAAQVVANPKQMVAAAVRALEQQGIPRAQQTPEMIQGILVNDPGRQQAAIEGTVTHSRMEQD